MIKLLLLHPVITGEETYIISVVEMFLGYFFHFYPFFHSIISYNNRSIVYTHKNNQDTQKLFWIGEGVSVLFKEKKYSRMYLEH